MNLKQYLDLYEVLENHTTTAKENRAFGLSHPLLKKKPIEQLIAWTEEHKKSQDVQLGETFSSYLYGVSLTLIIGAFVLGFFSGVGLLSYNGKEPVNVIYFMAMVIAFPLFTMMLTLFSMFRANASQSTLVHVSPAFWLEKVLGIFSKKMQINLKTFKINPLLSNWVVIKRSQLIAWFFSLGLLLALLGIVATKDIAFAWSTTLQVTPEGFHELLQMLTFAWRDILPSAVPSLSLIEHSQYFRLGDKLSQDMIANASELGQWWKFLAMATLFYALLLRLGMYVFASFGFRQALKKSMLSLKGSQELLSQMNDPILFMHVEHEKDAYVSSDESYGQIVEKIDSSYDVVQGWAMHEKDVQVLADSLNIIAPMLVDVGGTNSFKDDTAIIAKSKGEVLLFVKAWEPPTMDFVDFLEELTKKVDKVVVMPLGTVEEGYVTTQKYLRVWSKKLVLINDNKVWLKC